MVIDNYSCIFCFLVVYYYYASARSYSNSKNRILALRNKPPLPYPCLHTGGTGMFNFGVFMKKIMKSGYRLLQDDEQMEIGYYWRIRPGNWHKVAGGLSHYTVGEYKTNMYHPESFECRRLIKTDHQRKKNHET